MTGLRHQKLKDVTSELSQFSPFISRLMDIQNPTPIGIKRCPNVSDHSVVLVVQSLSCIQRCDPVDCGPPGSSVHGIFQARMLEWDAISFSGGFSWTRDWYMSPVLAGRFFTTKPPGKLTHVSVCVCVCVTQSCLTLCDSMDCSPPGSSVHGILQARILELPFPFPGDLPDPGIEPRSPALQADALLPPVLLGKPSGQHC